MKRNGLIFLGICAFLLLVSAFLNILVEKQKYVISSANTEANQVVSPFHTFSFQFNKALSEEMIEQCQIDTQPSVPVTTEVNDTTLQITAENRFNFSSSYILSLNCSKDNIVVELPFATHSESELSETDIYILQTQRDFDFANTLKEGHESQPWREKLPIETEQYVVVYSQVENLYFVRTTLPPNTTITREELSQEITAKLQEIGAPILELKWR